MYMNVSRPEHCITIARKEIREKYTKVYNYVRDGDSILAAVV